MKTPSVEPVLKSRLLPRVSFRFMLLMTTLAAVIAAVAKVAGEGDAFAYAVIVGVSFLGACFALFALLFLLTWSVSSLWYRDSFDTHLGNPFADGQLPPQILPPREQRS
ncbi:MAG: hypothetical protein ACR2NZ_21805 [Rubripirellula sp.]